MNTAKELLLNYISLIDNPDQAIGLFADDAVIELPYLASAGLPHRWEGKAALYEFLKSLPDLFPGFKFQNVKIYIDTPDQAFGEYEAVATLAANGKPYHQHYMGRLVAENGKIKLLREALDMAPVIRDMVGG